MNPQVIKVDSKRVDIMIEHLLHIIRCDLGPDPDQQQMLEAMNALGVCVAALIRHVRPQDPNDVMLGFFEEVLRVHTTQEVKQDKQMYFAPGQKRN